MAKRARRMAGWTSDESLGEFLRWWTTEYLPRRVANGRLAEETMDGHESSVRLHIVPRLGDVGLTDLTATPLEDWSTTSPTTVSVHAGGRRRCALCRSR